MRVLPAALVTETVARLFADANVRLPQEVRDLLASAREREKEAGPCAVLDQLIENYCLAEKNALPICQDTGAACVFVEIGESVFVEGSLREAVDEGVRQAQKKAFLRASIAADPLRRMNTGDNTPAFLYIESVPGDRLTITAAPKGFGSENMSRVKMLTPAAGEQGVIDFVVETVRENGANACPPLVLGIGLGGSFDKAPFLAKKALLRPCGKPSPDPYYAALEREILSRVNALGIGPAGLGGKTTALAVAIETLPTHIAGLPAALNVNCHAARHAQETL